MNMLNELENGFIRIFIYLPITWSVFLHKGEFEIFFIFFIFNFSFIFLSRIRYLVSKTCYGKIFLSGVIYFNFLFFVLGNFSNITGFSLIFLFGFLYFFYLIKNWSFLVKKGLIKDR